MRSCFWRSRSLFLSLGVCSSRWSFVMLIVALTAWPRGVLWRVRTYKWGISLGRGSLVWLLRISLWQSNSVIVFCLSSFVYLLAIYHQKKKRLIIIGRSKWPHHFQAPCHALPLFLANILATCKPHISTWKALCFTGSALHACVLATSELDHVLVCFLGPSLHYWKRPREVVVLLSWATIPNHFGSTLLENFLAYLLVVMKMKNAVLEKKTHKRKNIKLNLILLALKNDLFWKAPSSSDNVAARKMCKGHGGGFICNYHNGTDISTCNAFLLSVKDSVKVWLSRVLPTNSITHKLIMS